MTITKQKILLQNVKTVNITVKQQKVFMYLRGELVKRYRCQDDTVSVRPVLCMPGSPYYKMAEKFTKWMSPESQNQ